MLCKERGAGKTITLVHKGYAIKVILFSNQNSKNMNIIKRFARWVLREDLLNLDISIRSAERSLKEKNKELNDVQSKLNDWIL